MRIRRDKEHEIEGLTDEKIEVIAKASDALAHPVRIKLYRFIMKNNIDRIRLCNKDIVAAMDYSQVTISQHLTKLCKAGLLDTVKEDKFTYYYANMGVLMKYLNGTKKLFTFKFGE